MTDEIEKQMLAIQEQDEKEKEKEREAEFGIDDDLDPDDIIDIGDDFKGLEAFGQDPVWRIPLIRRVPQPDGSIKGFRIKIPVKSLTQVEILRLQEGMRLPKGSRNILDATMIKKYNRYHIDMFNEAIRRAGGKIKFVSVPKNTANYPSGEISIEDLSTDDMKRLEAAVSPGLNKSTEDYENELGSDSGTARPASKKSKRHNLDGR